MIILEDDDPTMLFFCFKNIEMKRIILFMAVLLNVCLGFAQLKIVKIEGIKRKYIVYLPQSYKPDKTYPVVFNFHGGGMTAAEQMLYTGMNRTADRYNFIVIYPAGIKGDWNVGFDLSYQKGINDIGFVKAILDSLKKDHQINKHAVFATGLSRGGFFCHRLASEIPDAFTAIASVGGTLPDSVKYYHHSKRKVAVMQVHGTSDQIVSYEGEKNSYASAQATFAYWKLHNGLANSKVNTRSVNKDKKDHTSVIIKEVSDHKTTVALVTINNGGHNWPGSHPFNIGLPLGYTSTDIDINKVIWHFFSKQIK